VNCTILTVLGGEVFGVLTMDFQGFNKLSWPVEGLMLTTMSVPSSKLQLFIASVIRAWHKHTPHKHHSASQSSPAHRFSEDVVISDIQPELSQTYPLTLPPPEEQCDDLEDLASHMPSSAALYDHGTAPVSSSNCRIRHLGADASSLLLSQAYSARFQSFHGHDLHQLTPADTLNLASIK